jgi:hypothetical protein
MQRRDVELTLLREWAWFSEVAAAIAEDEELLHRDATQDNHDLSCWWTVKDHLAHCAGTTLAGSQGVLEFVEDDYEQPFMWYLLPKSRDLSAEDFQDFTKVLAKVDETTHELWKEIHDMPWPEVEAYTQMTRSHRLKVVSQLTDEQLEHSVGMPGGGYLDGTVGGHLANAGVHQRMHLRWVMAGLAAGGSGK